VKFLDHNTFIIHGQGVLGLMAAYFLVKRNKTVFLVHNPKTPLAASHAAPALLTIKGQRHFVKSDFKYKLQGFYKTTEVLADVNQWLASQRKPLVEYKYGTGLDLFAMEQNRDKHWHRVAGPNASPDTQKCIDSINFAKKFGITYADEKIVDSQTLLQGLRLYLVGHGVEFVPVNQQWSQTETIQKHTQHSNDDTAYPIPHLWTTLHAYGQVPILDSKQIPGTTIYVPWEYIKPAWQKALTDFVYIEFPEYTHSLLANTSSMCQEKSDRQHGEKIPIKTRVKLCHIAGRVHVGIVDTWLFQGIRGKMALPSDFIPQTTILKVLWEYDVLTQDPGKWFLWQNYRFANATSTLDFVRHNGHYYIGNSFKSGFLYAMGLETIWDSIDI
jgi:hypothetical protein